VDRYGLNVCVIGDSGVSSMTRVLALLDEPVDEEPPDELLPGEPELLHAPRATVITAAAARPFMNVCFIA
jgi:hypothetical protein